MATSSVQLRYGHSLDMCTLFSASHLRLYNVSASVSFVIIQTVHLRVILYSQFDGIDLSIKYRSYCAIPPITLVNARNIITATRKKNSDLFTEVGEKTQKVICLPVRNAGVFFELEVTLLNEGTYLKQMRISHKALKLNNYPLVRL